MKKIAQVLGHLIKVCHNYAANRNLSANFADHAEEIILQKMVNFNQK